MNRSPNCTVDDVLITDELARRPARPPSYEAEARAMGELAAELAVNPQGLLQKVVDVALSLCRADSAGISILEAGGAQEVFRWHAVAGSFAVNVHGSLPSNASPCAEVMNRNDVLVFDRPHRFYSALRNVEPLIHEALLVPWHLGDGSSGTLWVLGHTPERHFDAEDARLLTILSRFAAAAWRARTALEASRTRDVLGRATQAHHRLVVDSARDYAIITMTPEGLIDSWSPGAATVFGWPAAEILGKPVAITFTPEDRAAEEPEKEQAAARDQGVAPDVRWHVRKDGQLVFIDGMTRSVRSEEGALLGFLKIGQDITKRREAEEAVRASEARYRALVDNLHDYAIFLLDAKGVIAEWTAGAERMMGYRPHEVVGRHVSLLYAPEEVESGVPQHELAEAAEQGRSEREGWRVRSGGERFRVHEIASAVLDAQGSLTGFTKIARNLTEQHKVEAAAEAMRVVATRSAMRRQLAEAEEEERRRLSRELHDEAGQHITALALGLQALSDVVLPGSDADRRTMQLSVLAETLGRELHSLGVRLRPRALDDFGLEAAVSSYAADWSRQIGIEIDVHADLKADRLPSAVENALYRIVQESLTNIAKHSGATRASVMIERRNGHVHAIIDDDGRGFDAVALAAQPLGTERGSGLLGIRERVDLLGGTLQIETSPGEGTTLFIRLPVSGAQSGLDASLLDVHSGITPP